MTRPFRYSGFGLTIESELELPELCPIAGDHRDPDVVIRVGTVPRGRRKTTLDEEFVLNAAGLACLIRHGREITVEPRLGADPQAIRVILMGRVMAFLLRQKGWLPLHASGVVIRQTEVCGAADARESVNPATVLFLGASGVGKSTIAAAFHRLGHLVITDDVGAVRATSENECVVKSAWSCVRLQEDAREILGDSGYTKELQGDKYRYDLLERSLRGSYPVRSIYLIADGPRISAEPVPRLEAAFALSRNSFVRPGNMTRDALELHLRHCATVASVVPVRRLVRPRSYDALPAVIRFVEKDLCVPWSDDRSKTVS